MNGSLATVNLDRLDWEDHRFAIRSFAPIPSALEASLERNGILSPPRILRGKGERCVIVDGFKRLEWLRKKGAGDAQCFVVPEAADRSQLMLRRIEEKLFGPPLNTAEKAQIVSKLAGILPEDDVLGIFFPLFGAAPKPGAVERWSRLASGGDGFLSAVAGGEISERAALELAAWEDGARDAAVALLRELRCSASIQTEILERVTEVALRDGMPMIDILQAVELTDIAAHPEWNHRRKTQLVRDLLSKWRFPRLHTRLERFRSDLAAARLPAGTKLIPPPAFEGDAWQVEITFSRPEDLPPLLDRLQEFAVSPRLQSLMIPAQKPVKKPAKTRTGKERRPTP